MLPGQMKPKVNVGLSHVCSIKKETSRSYLPPLPPNANWFSKFRRAIKKTTLISELNPRCSEFHKSAAEVALLRKAQVKANSCIIHPFSLFRLYYEMWMAVIFTASLVLFPLDTAFDIQKVSVDDRMEWLNYVNVVLSVVCLVDIIMWFSTGYVKLSEQIVVMKPLKIAQNYIISVNFISDLLSSLSMVELVASDVTTMRVVNLLQLLKIVRIKKTYIYMKRTAEFFKANNSWFRAVLFSIFTFLVLHWLACILYLLPQIRSLITGQYHPYTWVFSWKIFAKPLLDRYIPSFYRASGFILCVRMETSVTAAWEEILMACLALTFGKLFYLFLTVVLVQLLLSRNSLETKYFEIMQQVEGFMNKKRLPVPMRRKLRQYYHYKYNNTYFKENKITGLLSESLRKGISAEVLFKLTNSVEIFAHIPIKTLENILAHLSAEIYLPHDIIIKAGEFGDSMYFLASGTVAISTPTGKEDGDYFGEISLLFKDKRRTANVVAVEICEVYKLSRKGFHQFFKPNKELMMQTEVRALERIEMTQVYEDIHMSLYDQKNIIR